MKYVYLIIISITVLILNSCTEDDIVPTLVTTSDYEITINDIKKGATVGEVPGTSNKGSVTFEIASQTPEGIFTIGRNYGELVVNDISVSPGDKISLKVNVRKENITKVSNVVITIGEPCDSPVNTSIWEGALFSENLDIDGEPFGFEEVMGIPRCGELLVNGDLVAFGCPDFAPQIKFIFTPAEEGATNGNITVEQQDYNCLLGSVIEIEATGLYDEITRIIEINYTITETDFDPVIGSTTITIN